MSLQVNLPFSMWEYKISGVYRIIFDDGYFYIGCSSNLRSRASAWESIFKTKKGIAGKDIGTAVITKIKEGVNAVLEIVELCAPADLKDKEGFYLDRYKDDQKMVSWEHGAWKPVLQYKTDGVFIKKHFSIHGAAKYNRTKVSAINKILSGERNQHKGMVFIFEHDYQARRRGIIKRRYKIRERKMGRDVLMYNQNGDFVKSFRKIVDAAVEIGCADKNVSRVLNGLQKTAKGFVFKYA